MALIEYKTIGEHISDVKRLFTLKRNAPPATRQYNVRRARARMGRRQFAAAANNRLTVDWRISKASANEEIYKALEILRGRSRELSINNDYAKRFLSMLKRNVVGPGGIKLQAQMKFPNGKLDDWANGQIETFWRAWGKKGVCTTDGQLSWIDAQKLFIETVAKDGEALIRKRSGFAGNEYFYALEFIEADHLPVTMNEIRPNGNRVVMGIEIDRWRRPVAYYLYRDHPGDRKTYVSSTAEIERVPASEIVHGFVTERPGQLRGVPWMAPSMFRMRMLNSYEEAELVASRTAAAKMGFFTSEQGEGYQGEEDTDGNLTMDAEPGLLDQLPAGVGFEAWDPQHPTTAFSAFVGGCLRGIASGIDVSYVNLANDLKGVSYSSIRQGTLEERDAWRMIQTWTAEHFSEPAYSDWLTMFLSTGLNIMELANIDRYRQVKWQPRGWSWVDPQREIVAKIAGITNGVDSLTGVHNEMGKDTKDVLTELAGDKVLAESLGLYIPAFTGGTEKEVKTDENKADD